MSIDALATRRARRKLLLIAAGLIALAVVLWQASPLRELATQEQLARWLGDVRESPWGPLAMLLVYVLAGLVEFPVVVLIAVTGLIFEPATAFFTSLGGGLLSSLVFYWLGARLTRRTMHAALGGALARTQAALHRGGIFAIVVLRSIPFAPFSVVNLAAGSLGIPLRDYLVGTALGLLPGTLVLTTFGERLRAALREPTPGNLALLGVAAAVWVMLVWGMQRWARRTRPTRVSPTVSDGPRQSPTVEERQ